MYCTRYAVNLSLFLSVSILPTFENVRGPSAERRRSTDHGSIATNVVDCSQYSSDQTLKLRCHGACVRPSRTQCAANASSVIFKGNRIDSINLRHHNNPSVLVNAVHQWFKPARLNLDVTVQNHENVS